MVVERIWVVTAFDHVRAARVLEDEAEHLNYAESWLKSRFPELEPAMSSICRKVLPVTTAILQAVAPDMRAIGMDPLDLVASFFELFQSCLETVGYDAKSASRLIVSAAASAPMARATSKSATMKLC